jgi:hypothetical protein
MIEFRHQVAVVALALLATQCTPAEREDVAGEVCQMTGTARLPGVPEASGLAASSRTPGVFWTHNDTGEPVVFAVDSSGSVTGQVRISGAEAEDWEAIAVAPCSGGSCLVIADIGDNSAERDDVTLYRVPEPAPGDSVSAPAQAFRVRYPDGAQDAEALLAMPRGEMFVITKGESGPVGVYRLLPVEPGATGRFRKIATLDSGKVKRAAMITDAAASPDGKVVVLRSNDRLFAYRARPFVSGRPDSPVEVDLTQVGEPQGEGMAFGMDGLLYLAGEGGGKGQPGTLARLRCALPR